VRRAGERQGAAGEQHEAEILPFTHVQLPPSKGVIAPKASEAADAILVLKWRAGCTARAPFSII
jgi:hypothetical protein